MSIQVNPNISGSVIAHDNRGGGVYPFSDTCSMTSVNGDVVPKGAILDARIYTTSSNETTYISLIDVSESTLTIYISDNSYVDIAKAIVELGDQLAIFLDSFGREVGVIYADFDKLRSALGSTQTLFEFDTTALTFVSSVLIPQPRNVLTSLYTDTTKAASGDIWLVGEDGAALTVSGNIITININSDPLFKRKSCEVGIDSSNQYTQRQVKAITINNELVYPDQYGIIIWRVSSGASINDSSSNVGTSAEDSLMRIFNVDNGISVEVVGNFN